MKEEKKKKFITRHKVSAFIIVIILLMLIGLSYAWLQITLKGNKELTLIAAGTLYLELDDSMEGGITIENAVPVSDTEGKSGEGYHFTLENKGKIDSNYTIYLDDLPLAEDERRMEDSFIRYSLVKNDEEETLLLSKIIVDGNKILDLGNIAPGEKYTYTLKLWIDKEAGNEIMGTTFKGKLRIEAMQDIAQVPTSLVIKPNDANITYDTATEEEKKEMFTISHEPGRGQVGYQKYELIDYRYMGPNPNNYVTFNNEMWRIIGIFLVEDETGKKEYKMKLIRNESIGNYSWDNKGEKGENDWHTSSLQQILNSGAYYNRASGSCPTGPAGATKACDFTNIGLTDTAKNMISRSKWYIAGYGNNEYQKATASHAYRHERGVATYPTRKESWIGEVGLMYPSDYGYAAGSKECLSKVIYEFGNSSNCKNEDWLYRSIYAQWTLTAYSDVPYSGFLANAVGNLGADHAVNIHAVRPSIYLKSNVKISSGNGTETNPYQLTME